MESSPPTPTTPPQPPTPAPGPEPSGPAAAPAGSAPASAPAAKKRILCIEDERFIGELYKRTLETAGYQVDVVSDGQQGLDAILSNVYDIVLLDIMIPQILGIDVLHKVRTEKPDLKAKIIITTNLEQDNQTRSKIEQEADGYLIKAEITPHELAEFLNQL